MHITSLNVFIYKISRRSNAYFLHHMGSLVPPPVTSAGDDEDDGAGAHCAPELLVINDMIIKNNLNIKSYKRQEGLRCNKQTHNQTNKATKSEGILLSVFGAAALHSSRTSWWARATLGRCTGRLSWGRAAVFQGNCFTHGEVCNGDDMEAGRESTRAHQR